MQFSCAITLFSSAVTLFIYAIMLILLKAARFKFDVRRLGTKLTYFKMAVGLLFLSFFAFHGTYGNQTENNVNIFLIVNCLIALFCFTASNHLSLIGVAAVGTKNYVIATGTGHLEYVAAR